MKGWQYWILTCLLGSLLQSVLFTIWINKENVFNFEGIDIIFLIAVLFILSVFFSFPMIILFFVLLKRIEGIISRMFFFLNLILLLYCFAFYFVLIGMNLMGYNDALELIIPYWSLGVLVLNIYIQGLKKGRAPAELDL